MKIWFIRHNNESLGPYTVEELKNLGITKEHYVWKEGLPGWVLAKSVSELNPLFIAAPPAFMPGKSVSVPIGNQSTNYSYGRLNKIRWRLLWIGILLVLSFVTYLVYASQSARISPFDASSQKSPEQLKAELVQTEKQNPGRYISGHVANRKNLIGQTVVEGTLTSSATIAVFKDVVLQVDFMSRTNSIISSQNFTVYGIFRPGETVAFKEKALAGKDVQDVHVTVVGATPVE